MPQWIIVIGFVVCLALPGLSGAVSIDRGTGEVPEPATMLLLGTGLLGLAGLSRRKLIKK